MQSTPKARQYKICYANCKKGGMHSQEPLNIVCLDEACVERRLLCSICKAEEHAKHQTQPLKYYIDALHKTFQGEEKDDIREKMNELEEKKNEMLATLQETVNSVALKFKELEEQILKRFQAAKEKILEVDAMKKGFQEIYSLLSTPNHPDLAPMISKYSRQVPSPSYPSPQRLATLESSLVQQLSSALSYMESESAKLDIISTSVKLLCPPNISFDGEIMQQIADNGMNLCLLNEPITVENSKCKFKILSDKINLAVGVISMAEFKKYGFQFVASKAVSNYVYWISSDGKGSNYTSNSITSWTKDEVFDMSLKKGQLAISKKKSKQYSSLTVKDLGVDWYFFWAITGPGKVQVVEKSKK